MADRNLEPICYHYEKKMKRVVGSFRPNGVSAVLDKKGKGFTVVRTSAGLFTVTFSDKFVDLYHVVPHLRLATGDDKIAQAGTFSMANKTLQIRVWDISGAAETDVAADANNVISFVAEFKDSSV